VIQSWRGPDSLATAATKGYQAILSAGYYLDHLSPRHTTTDRPAHRTTAQTHPRAGGAGAGRRGLHVAELADAETVDSRVWPRAAVIAERLWSPKELTDVDLHVHPSWRREPRSGLDWRHATVPATLPCWSAWPAAVP